MHNNYLTLPVVFTMLAGHFPLAFGRERAWLVLLAIFALVAAIRHFFNLWHVGRRPWWILAAAAAGAVALAVALEPDTLEPAATTTVTDEQAQAIVAARCVTCHQGLSAPAGVQLETLSQIRFAAPQFAPLVQQGIMPPGNATGMTAEEREQLVAWATADR